MDISIILRFHNEESYLPAVMNALSNQDFPKDRYELIAVDNCSTDSSRKIVSEYTSNVLSIDEYRPGKALNQAIRGSRGETIAILSAHAIPSNRAWLKTLHAHMNNRSVAGVYGAQLYPTNSRFLDKRDLDIFSSLTPRVEKTDSDFWNANAMCSRSVWETQAFEEEVYELEDHYWTKQVLPKGFEVHFEPEALVYHYGHIKRIDREYLAPSSRSEQELIDNAIIDLNGDGDWATVMRAGLTLSSLTRSPGIERAIHPLGKALLTHPDFDVRWRMAQGLGKIPAEASADYLVKALYDPSFYPRDEAAWSLARLGNISVSHLIAWQNRFPPQIIPFVALALGGSGVKSAEERAVSLLLAEIGSGDVERQRNAVYFAGEIEQASSLERLVAPLTDLLDAEDDWLQAVCCWALGRYAERFHDSVAWAKIESLARSHPNLTTRFEAVGALGRLALARPNACSGQLLQGFLSDQESRIRYGAMQNIRLLMERQPDPQLMTSLFDWQDDDFGVMYELSLIRECS